MKAVYYEKFGGPVSIRNVSDPRPAADGVVILVEATGLCLSDWHGWIGHDPDIRLPHVPGHELAGTIAAVGSDVKNWQVDERVTLPFVCGCGSCRPCLSGNHQICDHQFQPGFTHWGSFAEYVAIKYADQNLVRIPENMQMTTAASLGCRFATSFRAVTAQGRVKDGDWVAVHGCGGVGLSAVMIASALGARVIAVDIHEDKLRFAKRIGAEAAINASHSDSVADEVKAISDGGVHVSLDALGHPETCFNSIANLRKQGRHVQVGLMTGESKHPSIPMDLVIANELEIAGSHGLQAARYPEMFAMIQAGKLAPEKLIQKTISLADAPAALVKMDRFQNTGVTVISSLSSTE